MRALDCFQRAYATDDLNQQIEGYSEAIRLDPGFAAAYNNRGVAYAALGQFGLATVDYTCAIQLWPNYAAPYFGRALACLEIATGDAIEAVRFALFYPTTQALRDPALMDSYTYAVEDLNQALRLKPEMKRSYLYRGVAYHRLHEHKRAILDYTQAIWYEPHSPEGYTNRALAYAALRRFEEALPDARHVLRQYPTHAISVGLRPLVEVWRKETKKPE